MASGICVFAENYNGNIESVVAELVRAAHFIKETTGEKIQAVVVAKDCDHLIKQLEQLGIDEVYAVKADRECAFQDDALSQVIAEMIQRIDPSSVLIPATPTGRSIFSRVAARLGCGLTADCTELLVDTREDNTFYIKQNKPSFGENVFVTIVTKEGFYPQMMTVRPGVYMPYEAAEDRKAEVRYFDDIVLPESKIEVIESVLASNETDSILSAEVVVVGGRGAESEENFALLKAFADKLGAAIGGTSRWQIQDSFRSSIRSDRPDSPSVRRSASPLEYPEQYSIQKESKTQNYLWRSTWMKALQFSMYPTMASLGI